MSAFSDGQVATTTMVRGCLVVTFPQDIEASLEGTQSLVLDEIRRSAVRFVVLELSAVKIMDHAEFSALRELVAMTRYLGARPFLVGLSVGVVAYLVNNNADTEGLEVARALEDVLDRIWSDGPERNTT